jgi:hypothetical protein
VSEVRSRNIFPDKTLRDAAKNILRRLALKVFAHFLVERLALFERALPLRSLLLLRWRRDAGRTLSWRLQLPQSRLRRW